MRYRLATYIFRIALCAVPALGYAAADNYPDRVVRIVVPYAPGGATDTAARMISSKLSELTKVSFVVDNKAGATGTIGIANVVRSKADGYTLLAYDTTYTILPNLFSKLPWNHSEDVVPITTIMSNPMVLLVPWNSPFKSIKELIAYAKNNPNKLNFGSGGNGSSIHLATELFLHQADIKMIHVPYKGGGEAMTALMGGQVDMLMEAPPTAMGYIKGEKVRALAISSKDRISQLSDVPTFAEQGYSDYKVMSWFGVAAPKGTPASIINELESLITKAVTSKSISDQIYKLGAIPGGIPTTDFSELIASEIKMWGALATQIGLKPQ